MNEKGNRDKDSDSEKKIVEKSGLCVDIERESADLVFTKSLIMIQ